MRISVLTGDESIHSAEWPEWEERQTVREEEEQAIYLVWAWDDDFMTS